MILVQFIQAASHNRRAYAASLAQSVFIAAVGQLFGVQSLALQEWNGHLQLTIYNLQFATSNLQFAICNLQLGPQFKQLFWLFEGHFDM